jgi:hypothetical protein
VSATTRKPPVRDTVRVEDLQLDPLNPRLPEEQRGADQVSLLSYLSENGVLDELIRSMADNGFFEHEPLIAYRDPKLGVIALEGNRRLASLKILTGSPEARDLGLEPALEAPLSKAARAGLRSVPVYLVASREEVHQYLGFRHIGGIKTWSAESKARYLMEEVDKSAKTNPNPFLDVARRVGSNSLGIRNSYTAVGVLRHARDEFGLAVTYVLHRRFGVWTRCMTAPEVRHYVGLNGAKSYEEVREDIESVQREPLAEVLADLTPPRGKRKALVNDSRDVTVYGQVLMHDVARRVLRQYEDLQVARQVVELAALPDRLLDLRDRIDIARDEAQSADWSAELQDATEDLFRSARAIRATVGALNEADDVD